MRDLPKVTIGIGEVAAIATPEHLHRFLGDGDQRLLQVREEGIHFGLINARFVKPLDTETIFKAIENLPLVVTVEEGTLEGGFGSAVLEAANTAGLDTRNIVRKGIPDKFIEHAERGELLQDLGLDVQALVEVARKSRAMIADGIGVGVG